MYFDQGKKVLKNGKKNDIEKPENRGKQGKLKRLKTPKFFMSRLQTARSNLKNIIFEDVPKLPVSYDNASRN